MAEVYKMSDATNGFSLISTQIILFRWLNVRSDGQAEETHETGKFSLTRGQGCNMPLGIGAGGRTRRRDVIVREYIHVKADYAIIPSVKLFYGLIYAAA